MKYQNREEIEEKYKWDLKHIFPTIEDWQKAYDKIEENIKKLKDYEGKLADSSETLLGFLNLDTETSELFERIAVYARMSEDENTKDPERQTLVQKISPLSLKYSTATSFFSNEVLKISEEKMQKFYKNENLLFYKDALTEMLRGKSHVLSPEKEEVLAQTGLLYSAGDTFRKLDNADLVFEDIYNSKGEKLPLNNANFSTYLSSNDRTLREQAFKSMYKAYSGMKNTISSTMLGNLNKDKFYAQIRNYNSSIERALFDDNISTEVYENLIKAVHENLPSLHEYVKLRKEILGYKELHTYDMYVELFDAGEKEIPYEKAYEMMLDALSVLGEDYINKLIEARDGRWIDVYPTEGKRNGAYSWGPYKKAYVLLNHKDDLDSAMTLVHEMGHHMHSRLSDNNLPYTYAQYSIFVAEVASTVNEVLLMRYLIDKATDDNEKKYLISEFLDKFKSTLFRQTQFAEFEKIAHEKVDKDETLTGEDMNNIYAELNKKYYGEALTHDEEIQYEWSRIPHFYNGFYVFQYATGFSAAIAIADRILTEGQPAVDDYLKFLSSGGSDYPIELLKIAGVDMSTPKPVNDALKVFKDLIEELKELNK